MELNTTNPYCFTFQTDELLIELLGGVRVDGLDRMRVTMKITVVNRKHAGYLSNPELAGLSVRHNLDLYNDTQVEKFVRRVAEKLETGSIVSIPVKLSTLFRVKLSSLSGINFGNRVKELCNLL
jgi:hypothetical protein